MFHLSLRLFLLSVAEKQKISSPRFAHSEPTLLSIEMSERRNERRLNWLSHALDKKTFDIEADHAAMRLCNRWLEALGFNARFVYGHGMVTRFELRGDPNPLINAVNPFINNQANANVNHNNIGHEANADNLGPVKIEAPEPEPQPNNAPYYGPPVRKPKNVHLNPFARIMDSSDDDITFDDPVPAKKKVLQRKRPAKGNVASESKKVKVKTEFEGINFGSKIVELINNMQNKEKKKKKKDKESFEVTDLNGPKKGGKRRRDRDDDDDLNGHGFGLIGSKRSRREIY